MKKTLAFGLVVTAFGLWAGSANAQGQGQQGRQAGDIPGPIDSLSDLQDTGRMIFRVVDENGDGQISQKEAVDAAHLMAGGFFFRADKNGDGVLSQDEVRAAREEFLSTKPWLRYAIETAQAQQRGQQGQAGGANSPQQNPLRTLAAAFDTNNDKQLQASELRTAVQTAVQTAFATADTNRDGNLSPAEVNAAMAGVARTVAQAAFQQADKDNNGSISQAEFEQAIVQPARTAFAIMDLNHDGQLSQQEAQTARQVLMSKLRTLNMPEPGNSPRNAINSALGNQTAPPANAAPAAPANPPR
jgi:Ca2+-binding EF-hand superfamily protein